MLSPPSPLFLVITDSFHSLSSLFAVYSRPYLSLIRLHRFKFIGLFSKWTPQLFFILVPGPLFLSPLFPSVFFLMTLAVSPLLPLGGLRQNAVRGVASFFFDIPSLVPFVRQKFFSSVIEFFCTERTRSTRMRWQSSLFSPKPPSSEIFSFFINVTM